MLKEVKEFLTGWSRQLGAAKKTYDKNGYAVLPQVYTQDEVDTLRRAALHSLSQAHEIPKAGYKHSPLELVGDPQCPSPGLIFWPALVNEVMDTFRTDARLQQIVRHFLGPNVKQLNNQFYYRMAGDTDSFAWHQDIMFRTPLEEYPKIVEENAYLQTAIIVDRADTSNAAVIYLKGSHKLGFLRLHENGPGNPLRGFEPESLTDELKDLEPVALEVNPGDVAVWSALTVHGSPPNESRSNRMYLMNGFARAENCNPWPWYLKNGELSPLVAQDIP